MLYAIKKACILVLICASFICSLKLTFERAYIMYFNPKYVDYAFVNVTRYGRRNDTIYYGNIEYDSKFETTNNVSIHIYFYEFFRNQYKRSFIETHHKMCDFLAKDQFIGIIAAKKGFACPVSAGRHSILNLTTNFDHVMNVSPFEKGRIDFWFNVTSTGEPVAAATLYFNFKNEVKGKSQG